MFSRIMSSNLDLCGHYILGKQKRVRFTTCIGKSCVFLGYGDIVKGNRLWVPTALNVIISQDDTVNAKSMQRKEKQQTPKIVQVELDINKDESEYKAFLVVVVQKSGRLQ